MKRANKRARWMLSIATLGAASCLGACQKSPSETQAAPGQEVARVGSDPITTSELQLELNGLHLQTAPSDRDKAAALQRIAARKSLAQKAIAAGLDRQPTILLEIRKAREQILANAAAIADVKKEEQKVSLEAVNSFIAAHPEQFANRRLLAVNELLVPAKNDVDKIVAAVKDATTLDQVEKYLTDNKIPFQKTEVALDTATLPDLLTQSLLKNANVPVVRTPQVNIFMQLKQSQPAPVTGATAEKLAKVQMARSLFEKEMAAPSAGDDVVYMPPYKDMVEKLQAPAPAKAPK